MSQQEDYAESVDADSDVRSILLDRRAEFDRPPGGSVDNALAWAGVSETCENLLGLPRGALLDEEQLSGQPLADVVYFVGVSSDVEAAEYLTAPKELALIPADEADTIMNESLLLGRITRAAPEIANGPLRCDSQYWIGSSGNSRPSAAKFVAADSDDNSLEPRAKPHGSGIFTCTGVLGTYGMWRIYLEMQGAGLFGQPWYTWRVSPDREVRVREIRGATGWVQFVEEYQARTHAGLLVPDWRRVAGDYDAVHMTLRAVAAIEGLPFPARGGVTAPGIWGVESALWLRWRMHEDALCEVIPDRILTRNLRGKKSLSENLADFPNGPWCLLRVTPRAVRRA
jgi:hypothetical protein